MFFNRFESALNDYLSALGKRDNRDNTHDFRRSIFIDFLRAAFDIKVEEVLIEERLRIDEVRGFIDALYKSIIFEFKKDLRREREAGLEELGRYFKARPDASLAFLTDGYQFEVYIIEDGSLRLINGIDLRKLSAADAHLFFDSYLFKEHNLTPVSSDVVARFGSKSPTYAHVECILATLWDKVKNDPTAGVKWSEWDRLLAKVYGSSIGSDDLFLRHTDLSILARAFAYGADLLPKLLSF